MQQVKRIRPKLADMAKRLVVQTPGAALSHQPEHLERPAAAGIAIEIRKLTNRDADFYPLMGPFLANRKVAAELGMPAWDDPGKRWYVAVQNGAVAGFAGVTVVKTSIHFCSAWVSPEKRAGGIYAALLKARLADYATQRLSATATELSKAALERNGFRLVRPKGKYFEMERAPQR